MISLVLWLRSFKNIYSVFWRKNCA